MYVVDQYSVYILSSVTDNFLESAEGRMTTEIISWSVSTSYVAELGFQLGTPGSSVTNCLWSPAQMCLNI